MASFLFLALLFSGCLKSDEINPSQELVEKEYTQDIDHDGQEDQTDRESCHVDGMTLPLAPVALAQRGIDGRGHRYSMDHDGVAPMHPNTRNSEDDVGLQAAVLTDDHHHP